MPSTKPSQSEEEYFAKEEAEKLKRLALQKQDHLQKEEKEKLKKLHWMHCPNCGMELSAVVYRGVTIDQCFGCKGVFLAQDELEKLTGEENSFFESVASLFK